jgi:transposase-like protein
MKLLFGYSMLRWYNPQKGSYEEHILEESDAGRLWLRSNIFLLHSYIRDFIFKKLQYRMHYTDKFSQYDHLLADWKAFNPVRKLDAAKFARDIDLYFSRIDESERKLVSDEIYNARKSAKSLVEAEKMINNGTVAN